MPNFKELALTELNYLVTRYEKDAQSVSASIANGDVIGLLDSEIIDCVIYSHHKQFVSAMIKFNTLHSRIELEKVKTRLVRELIEFSSGTRMCELGKHKALQQQLTFVNDVIRFAPAD